MVEFAIRMASWLFVLENFILFGAFAFAAFAIIYTVIQDNKWEKEMEKKERVKYEGDDKI